MKIILNGETREVPDGHSVRDLLDELELDPGTVAVEVNREIVNRGKLGERVLRSGDTLEVLHFVGGG